jgi:hypothetical protein
MMPGKAIVFHLEVFPSGSKGQNNQKRKREGFPRNPREERREEEEIEKAKGRAGAVGKNASGTQLFICMQYQKKDKKRDREKYR